MKTWLITGCSSGFGRSMAECALEMGDNVVVTARNLEAIADIARKDPEGAFPLPLDVTNQASMERAVDAALERFGRIDVLVNNAGYCLRGAVEECSMEQIRRQFETNFFGLVGLTKLVLPHMRERRSGTIVNFSSIAALYGAEGSAFYSATKCAVEGFSMGLSKELEPLGIKVLVIEPGPFVTDFFERSLDLGKGSIGDYDETSGKRKVRMTKEQMEKSEGWGDTKKAAEVIFDVVSMEYIPFRLLLGSRAVELGRKFCSERLHELSAWGKFSRMTDR